MPFMKNIFTFYLFVFTTLHIAVAPASAHGYVTYPPSRQARCHNNEVPGCGPVGSTPDAVEGPWGSLQCNGGSPRFPELNNETLWSDHFFWIPQGARYLTFTWELTTPYKTSLWEYFFVTPGHHWMLIGRFEGHNSTPPLMVTHYTRYYNITGRQTILARWNIADPRNHTFYSCIDLYIMPIFAAGADAAVMQQPIGIPLTAPEPGLAMPMVPV